MTIGKGACAAALMILRVVLAFGQSAPNNPIKTPLCELLSQPARFNDKLVEVRAHATVSANSSEGLRDDSCASSLFFSSDGGFPASSGEYSFIDSPADLRNPMKLAWKPIRLPAPVKFVYNEAFNEYKRYVFQKIKDAVGRTCFSCPAFDITMTVVGRFDYVEKSLIAVRENSNAEPHWFLSGFGHMHGLSTRLVWQSISDVIVKPVNPSVYRDPR